MILYQLSMYTVHCTVIFVFPPSLSRYRRRQQFSVRSLTAYIRRIYYVFAICVCAMANYPPHLLSFSPLSDLAALFALSVCAKFKASFSYFRPGASKFGHLYRVGSSRSTSGEDHVYDGAGDDDMRDKCKATSTGIERRCLWSSGVCFLLFLVLSLEIHSIILRVPSFLSFFSFKSFSFNLACVMSIFSQLSRMFINEGLSILHAAWALSIFSCWMTSALTLVVRCFSYFREYVLCLFPSWKLCPYVADCNESSGTNNAALQVPLRLSGASFVWIFIRYGRFESPLICSFLSSAICSFVHIDFAFSRIPSVLRLFSLLGRTPLVALEPSFFPIFSCTTFSELLLNCCAYTLLCLV